MKDDKEFDEIDREWERCAAVLGPAIERAFPVVLMDDDTLQQIIGEISPPRNGVLSKIFSLFNVEFEFYDDELLEFVKILADQNWRQIDWNVHWQVVPLFTETVLAYCLPGLMLEYVMGTFDFGLITWETQVRDSLFPAIVPSDPNRLDMNRFTKEQKRVIADFVSALRDLTFFDNPELQNMADAIVGQLNDSQ